MVLCMLKSTVFMLKVIFLLLILCFSKCYVLKLLLSSRDKKKKLELDHKIQKKQYTKLFDCL